MQRFYTKGRFKPAKNSIRTADLYSSGFVTDNDLNSSTFGADLNLHRFKSGAVAFFNSSKLIGATTSSSSSIYLPL